MKKRKYSPSCCVKPLRVLMCFGWVNFYFVDKKNERFSVNNDFRSISHTIAWLQKTRNIAHKDHVHLNFSFWSLKDQGQFIEILWKVVITSSKIQKSLWVWSNKNDNRIFILCLLFLKGKIYRWQIQEVSKLCCTPHFKLRSELNFPQGL